MNVNDKEPIIYEFFRRIKKNTQKCFLSQETFANKLHVSFSSVNRWEGGRAKPNMIAMKRLKEFCKSNKMDFSALEENWLNLDKKTK